ncbi:tripartite tricarboxylate transporter substrate binding protein [Aquincola sp. MAHUQ-54]|uniref:Tripartite tricarboxylate transporter substrate binding protein n=1 Tax=Aquincola agrisoli TaxID=3119538 RepID=A0AAW9Q5C3_9BURK
MHRWKNAVAQAAAVACGLLAACGNVWAQAYPTQAVKIVVPYPPGGPTDIVARVVAQQLGEQLGQTVIVDNKPGAGGNLGAEAVARAAPDGYTLLVATTAHAINMSLFKNLNYDVQRDFAPVSLLTQGPLVLVTTPSFPAKNVAEVIALAKAKPGELNYASSGNGQSTHLAAELFATSAGVKLTHVPYKGSAPALTDVIAGQVPMFFDTMLSSMPFVKSGKLKALAVTSPSRSPAAPDIPTVAESGLPGYEVFAWNGLLAPAGTPPAVLSKLSAEMKKVLENPAVKDKFAAQGFAAAWTSPKQSADYVRAEVEKWRQAVAQSGAKVE